MTCGPTLAATVPSGDVSSKVGRNRSPGSRRRTGSGMSASGKRAMRKPFHSGKSANLPKRISGTAAASVTNLTSNTDSIIASTLSFAGSSVIESSSKSPHDNSPFYIGATSSFLVRYSANVDRLLCGSIPPFGKMIHSAGSACERRRFSVRNAHSQERHDDRRVRRSQGRFYTL